MRRLRSPPNSKPSTPTQVRLEPRLYEPLLIVSESDLPEAAGNPDQLPPPAGVRHFSDQMLFGGEGEGGGALPSAVKEEGAGLGGGGGRPVLHSAFHWSEDGLCLGAAMTDTTGCEPPHIYIFYVNVSSVLPRAWR